MTTVNLWPRVGASIPFPDANDPPLPTSGGQTFVPLSVYLSKLVMRGELLTFNPLSDDVPPPDYMLDAILSDDLDETTGSDGGQIALPIGSTGIGRGAPDFYWDATSTAEPDGGMVRGPSSGTGRWLRRLYRSERHLQEFLRDGASTIDNDCWERAIDSAVNYGTTIIHPPSTSNLEETLQIYQNAGSSGRDAIRIVGENAGCYTRTASKIMWQGNTTTDAAIRLWGSDNVLENISIDVASGKECLMLLDIGTSPTADVGTTHNTFRQVRFSAEAGGKTRYLVTIGELTPSNGNQDWCVFEHCWFLNGRYGVGNSPGTGLKVAATSGQSLHHMLSGCTFIQFQSATPEGVGIELVAGSFDATHCRFYLLERGMLIGTGPFGQTSVSLAHTESERCKRFYSQETANPTVFATVNIMGGRFSTTNVDVLTANFAADNHQYISIAQGCNFNVHGAFFGHTASAETAFKLNFGNAPQVTAIGCHFPNSDPFFGFGGLTSIGNRCYSNAAASVVPLPQRLVDTAATETSAATIQTDVIDLQGKKHLTRAAAPTTGTWAVGDIVYNNAPAASGFLGWVCTTAGTPGTWKTWGAISA